MIPNALPKLPTDNLYKHAALAGVTICLFCIGAFAYQLNTLTSMQRRVTEASDIVVYANPNASQKEREQKQVNFDRAFKAFDQYQYLFDIYMGVIAAGIITGVLLAGYGYRNWYERSQKYQDIITKCQAEEIQRKIQDPNKSSERTLSVRISCLGLPIYASLSSNR